VAAFPEQRRADLWSGVGLAATFAGGATGTGLRKLSELAGEYRPELALGMVFAVKARTYADFVPAHTDLAASALGGVSVVEALAIADGTEVSSDAGEPDGDPAYEIWRQRIRDRFDVPRRQALAG
jgi:hypothetical protein